MEGPVGARCQLTPLLLQGSQLEIESENKLLTCSVRGGDPLTASQYDPEFTVSAVLPMSFPGHYPSDDDSAPCSPAPAGPGQPGAHDDSGA